MNPDHDHQGKRPDQVRYSQDVVWYCIVCALPILALCIIAGVIFG